MGFPREFHPAFEAYAQKAPRVYIDHDRVAYAGNLNTGNPYPGSGNAGGLHVGSHNAGVGPKPSRVSQARAPRGIQNIQSDIINTNDGVTSATQRPPVGVLVSLREAVPVSVANTAPDSFWQIRADLQLRAEQGDAAAAAAVRQLEQSRASSTWSNYDGRFEAFAKFCGEKGYVCLPASPLAVVHYLGHLETQYRTSKTRGVHPDHLQIHLSSINTTHALSGADRPALGPLVSAARNGYSRNLKDVPVTHRRVPLRRAVILPEHIDILLEAAALDGDRKATVETGAIVLAYLFGERPISVAAVKATDLTDLTLYGITFTESRTKTDTLAQPRRAEFSGARRALLLYTLFRRLTSAPILIAFDARVFPELPLESPSTKLGVYVNNQFGDLHITPPPGEQWTAYSPRRGCATAMYVLDIPLLKALFWGNWKALASYKRYIDPAAAVSYAGAFAFFGFLLPAQALLDLTRRQ